MDMRFVKRSIFQPSIRIFCLFIFFSITLNMTKNILIYRYATHCNRFFIENECIFCLSFNYNNYYR